MVSSKYVAGDIYLVPVLEGGVKYCKRNVIFTSNLRYKFCHIIPFANNPGSFSRGLDPIT